MAPADPDANDDPDAHARRRPAPDALSPLEHAAAAATALEWGADSVRAIVTRTEPSLPALPTGALAAGDAGPAIDTVLDRVTAAANALAETIQGVAAPDWARDGTTPAGDRLTALDAAATAIEHASSELRSAADAWSRTTLRR